MCAERRTDRRVFPRAAAMGSAIVLAGERYVGTYMLENVSASGALLVGDTNLSEGDGVRLLLQLNHRARRFSLEASVVRHTKRGAQGLFAVQFAHVPAAVQDALQSAVLRHLDAQRNEVCLIVDLSSDDAAWLERDLQEIGREAVVVQTPLDVIVWLESPEALVGTVIANGVLDTPDGLSLLEFIGRDYSDVRRTLTCSGPLARVHREAVARGLAHAILEKPWTRDSLLQAVAKSP